MAQELSEKELLRMEVEQLKKEVRNLRTPVSPLFLSRLPLLHPLGAGTERRKQWTVGCWGLSRAVEGAGGASGMG